MEDFLCLLGIALICLGIGGCIHMTRKGDAAVIKAKAEAELMLRQEK